MSWNYRKRITIIPGLHINISRGGISTSIGPRGCSFTIKKDGIYSNMGFPGTGIYKREKIHTFFQQHKQPSSSYNPNVRMPILFTISQTATPISSEPSDKLTSNKYLIIINKIKNVNKERAMLHADLQNVKTAKGKTQNRSIWSKILI